MNEEHDEETTREGAPPPHRTRLSIPAADATTIEWLGQQENVSASIRHLVRDYVRKEGFTDPTCLAVEQQPRRGRPPGSKNRLGRKERRERLRETRTASDRESRAVAELADRMVAGEVTQADLEGFDPYWVARACDEAASRADVDLIELGERIGLLERNEYGDMICTSCGWRHPDHDRTCQAPRLRQESEMGGDLFDDEDEPSEHQDLPPLHGQIVKDTGWQYETHHDHEDGHRGHEGEN